MVVNGKTWKLSIQQLASRREMLGRELDEVAKRRDELRSTQLRAAEVKELIKATELGQEQEELKASIKDIELILEGLHRNVERLSREVLTEETGEPQDALPGVDTSKPPKAPRAPKPSAAERTLQLPEHAGPGLTGEAELHEGGPLAPPAPPVHRALPAARHADAIEADIVAETEGEPSEANVQRAILQALPKDGSWAPWEVVDVLLQDSMPGLKNASVERCVADLKRSGKIESKISHGAVFWRLVIEAPKAKPKAGKGKAAKAKPASKGKAPAKGKGRGGKAQPARALGDVIDGVLRSVGGWWDERLVIEAVRKEMPLNDQPSERDWKGIVDTMAKQGRIERREENGRAFYRTSPASLEAGRALSVEKATPAEERTQEALVLRALEDATKRRSIQALATATGLPASVVDEVIDLFLAEGLVVNARRGGYQLKSKAESRPEPKASKASKPSKKAPPAPPPCPPPPAKGHPQRVLRGWVYDRVAHTGQLPLETLQKESPGYHQEYIEGVVDLLLACDCLHLTAGLLRALELPSAPTVDQAILDEVAGILRDAPLTSAQIAAAYEVHHVIVFDVLQELRDAGRVALRGDAWHLTHGAQEEAA